MLKRTCLSIAALGALQLGMTATAADPPGSKDQARIAFADMGGIRNWRAEDRDTLLVQSRQGQWYRAEMFSSCGGLPFANAIGFVFEPDGSFDRFSSIVVDGRECKIKSLVKSDDPGSADAPSKPVATTHSKNAQSKDTQRAGEDARIPFANLGGIETWSAVDDDTLYIEGRSNQWYRAELLGFCPGLKFETAIGFVTRPMDTFDEFSSIVVDGRECHLKSLTKSGPPPEKG